VASTGSGVARRDQRRADVVILPPETWVAVRDRVAELLDAAEVDGVAGAIDWPDRRWLK